MRKFHYQYTGFFIRSVLTGVLFLFVTIRSQAQEDPPPEVVAVDTVISVAPEEEDSDNNITPEKEIYYFREFADTLSVQVRNLPKDVVKRYKEDEDFWYADAPVDMKNKRPQQNVLPSVDTGQRIKDSLRRAIEESAREEEEYTPVSQRSWFQTLLWFVIIGVFLAVMIMYLGSGNVGLFRRKDRAIDEIRAEDEMTPEDIFAINYQRDIDRAAAQGNYRLAIRLMFLRSLKNMTERNIIRYKQDKTNLDYLMELHRSPYYDRFFRITRHYEYAWYGLFPVSEEAYGIIRSEFDQFDKELRS